MTKISKLFLVLIAFVGLGITQSCNQKQVIKVKLMPNF